MSDHLTMPYIEFHISDCLSPKGERQSNILQYFFLFLQYFNSLIWWYLCSPFAYCKWKERHVRSFSFLKKEPSLLVNFRETALDKEILFFQVSIISQQQRNIVIFFFYLETIFQGRWISPSPLICTCIRERTTMILMMLVLMLRAR